MTYTVTENCEKCKYTDCVEVCPVEAFHEGPDMLYINPETCIDCNACVEECPVEAIYDEEEVSIAEGELEAVKKNYEFFGQEFSS